MIVLPEEQLQDLEDNFGPDVRHMGMWNTDGSFGFCAVPIAAVEKAAEAVGHPSLAKAVEELKTADDRTQPFVEIVATFGRPFVKEVAARYREEIALAYGPKTRRMAR